MSESETLVVSAAVMDDGFPVAIGIHPAAEVFRMMTADELVELTADIKANGLRDPIVLDAQETACSTGATE